MKIDTSGLTFLDRLVFAAAVASWLVGVTAAVLRLGIMLGFLIAIVAFLTIINYNYY